MADGLQRRAQLHPQTPDRHLPRQLHRAGVRGAPGCASSRTTVTARPPSRPPQKHDVTRAMRRFIRDNPDWVRDVLFDAELEEEPGDG